MRIRSFKRHLKVKRFKSKCESLSRFLQTILNLFLAFCYELEFSSLFIVFSPSSQTPCIIPTTCSPLFSFFRNLLSMVKFFSEDYLIILSFNTTLMWYIWALGNTKPWVGGEAGPFNLLKPWKSFKRKYTYRWSLSQLMELQSQTQHQKQPCSEQWVGLSNLGGYLPISMIL